MASSWYSNFLTQSPLIIAFTVLLLVLIPILLHLLFFNSPATTTLPSFLLIGPSGSGKTSLLTLFERGKHAATHTSQAPVAVEISLPVTANNKPAKYSSVNDPSLQHHKRFLLVDTPGHGKLRYHALEKIARPENLRGIIFVVDSANLAVGSSGLREAAEYLHDVLLQLQRGLTTSKRSGSLKAVPVLVAANKLDLFTALPAPLVKTTLEAEIGSVRASRSKGLLDSGIGTNGNEPDEEKDWLGEGGANKFTFTQMEEFDVTISVAGGNVVGGEGGNVSRWWDWIGKNM